MNKPPIYHVVLQLCREHPNRDKLLNRQGEPNQNELSRVTGIPQPTLQRIFKWESKSPRDATVAPLARFFGVSVAQIKGQEPLEKPPADHEGDRDGIHLPPDVLELARKIAELPPHAREAIKTIVNSLYMTHQLSKDSLAFRLLTAKADTPEAERFYEALRSDMAQRMNRVEAGPPPHHT